MGRKLFEIRDRFAADLASLEKRGLLTRILPRRKRGRPGFQAVALEVSRYCIVIRESWPAIEKVTALTEAEVTGAVRLAEAILPEIGKRRMLTRATLPSAKDTRRAFTDLLNAYDQVRRAVQYLRWNQGDADKIAPSLYRGRGGHHKRRHVEHAAAPTPHPAAPTSHPAAPTSHPAAPTPHPAAPTSHVETGPRCASNGADAGRKAKSEGGGDDRSALPARGVEEVDCDQST